MKIAVFNDLHLPSMKTASQYAVLDWAIADVIKEQPDLIVVNGDITAAGDYEAMKVFLDRMQPFPHMLLLGNSDVRDEFCLSKMQSLVRSHVINCNGNTVIGISTPEAKIASKDREILKQCSDHTILFMHHYPEALESESRKFIENLLFTRKITLIHGHKHMDFDRRLGKSRIFGVRGLDPDKVVGNMPCVAYFELSSDGIQRHDQCFKIDTDNLRDFGDYIGISCFSPEVDIDYAIHRGIKNIEIRKYDEESSFHIIAEKVKLWREKGGRYVSVHMPNLRHVDGTINGIEEWNRAVKLVQLLNAEGATVHVPRAAWKDMYTDGFAWRAILGIMEKGIREMPDSIKVGIENTHMNHGQLNNWDREFGYAPEECLMWIEALNRRFGYKRVGSILDVGHSFNNSVLSTRYTPSVWYEMLGQYTVAYHIHQVCQKDDRLSNHNAIEEWFGPKISYASFLWAWQNNHINHCPMFLEVRNKENCEASLRALEKVKVSGFQLYTPEKKK